MTEVVAEGISEQVPFTRDEMIKIYNAVKSDERYGMLAHLKDKGPMKNSELAAEFGLSERNYTFQIGVLKGAGLVWTDHDSYRPEFPSGQCTSSDMYVKTTEKGNKFLREFALKNH